jgi:hypothetical protein
MTTVTSTTVSASVAVSVAQSYPYMTFYANGKRARVQLFIGFDCGRERAEAIVNSIVAKYPTASLAKWEDGSKVFTERYWCNTQKRLVRSDRKGFVLNIPMGDMVVPSESKPGFRKLDVLRAWVNATQKPRLVGQLEANLATSASGSGAEVDVTAGTQPPASDRRSELEAMAWSDLLKLAQSLNKPKSLKKKAELVAFILENEF